VSNNPAAPRAQEPSSRNIVTDLRSRDRYMIAFNEAASNIDGANAFTVALGNRIALHFNCKTGRCDPGYDTLAKEMGTSERTVERHVKLLVDAGWFRRKRGGRDDKVSFTLCIPDAADHAPMHDLEPKNGDLIGDNILSPMDASSYLTKTPSIPDTQCGGTNEQRNRDRVASSPPASGLVDIDGPVTDDQRTRAFSALVASYPKYPRDSSDSQCREIFDQLIDGGIDHNDIIDGAAVYAERCKGSDPRTIRLLIYYLRVKGWLPENYHYMQPMPVLQSHRQPVGAPRFRWPTGSVPVAGNNTGIDRLTLASS
jgi:Helix-turn-helix domain